MRTRAIYPPLLALIAIFQYTSLLGQTSLTFTKYKTENGLSNEFVTTIFQDSIGFLWLGTPRGLNRYDGYNFKVFQYDETDSLSLSNNEIWNIEEDDEGNIWIGTNNGLNKLNPQTERITRIKSELASEDSLTNDQIMDLLVDDTGIVWVATANGLNRWLPELQCFQRYFYEAQPDKKRPFRTTRTPIQTRNGNIWLGLQDTLCRYIVEKDDFATIRLPENKPASNVIRLIYEDHQGLLWIGTRSNGVFSFDPNTNTFLEHYANHPNHPNSISHNKISALIQNGEELWIGTTGGGLNILNLKTKSIDRYTAASPDIFGVNSETIRDAWEDNLGNIWLGSFYDGLYQFKRNQRIFSNFDQNTGLLAKVVNDITETPDGKIWVAMGNAGVGIFDVEEKRFSVYYRSDIQQHGLPAGNLKRLHVDHYGHLWVASETTGISYFDKQVNKFKKHIPEHTEDLRHFDFLTDFLVEENGDIWIATQMGLAKYQVADQSYYEYTMPNPSNIQINYGENTFVTSIFKDSQQKLWFTTYGGLNLYHPEGDSLEFFPFEYQVLNLIEKDSNSFWAGSAEGLFTFDKLKKSFSKTLDEPAGIIVKERQGRIWLNAVDYSLGYDPDTNGKILLDQLDGMISDFFWQGHQAGDGYLYFGGTEGMTVFHPDSLPKATQSPRVVLTDFRLFNQTVPLKYSRGDTLDWQSPLTNSITFTKSVELKHWQNYFSFEFAALDFTNPSSNRYQYQLEGYDENWIEAGADRRFVTYTNINPGTYTFKVKAATRNGPWSTEAASVIIHISPPWYRTWWAYLTWGLLFFGLIYTFYRFQLNRRLAEAEATQVKALDEAKTRLYTNITHEFRTPITVILGLADEIQTRSKAQISAIKRNGKQLLQLVNQMLALSKLESGKEKLVLQQADVIAFTKYVVESFQSFAASQQIDVEMSSEIEELMMDYDAEKLQLILSNLIANAIKFTPVGGKVKIVLAKRTQQLHISISDTGEGISAEQLPYIFDRYYQADSLLENTGSGIGLTLVKEYVQMLKGKIKVKSEQSKGTTFSIQLPIHQQAAIKSSSPVASILAPIKATQLIEVESPTSLKEQPKLLLIEDNKDVLQYLSLFLKNDYELHYAYDGLEGVRESIAIIPDLIISDVMMPRKNGYEVCEQLKKDERTSHIPIILLTAKADFDSKIEGLELGAEVYLSKPFQKQELLVQINRLLEQRKALQTHYSQLAMLPTDRYQIKKGEESFLYRVQSTLEANLGEENFDIKALCEALHLSRMHLHRKLKALTGQSTTQYMLALRLERAKDLLKTTDLSISEITYRVGFKSQSHFSQAFAREIGQSPSVWRKEHP